MVSTAVCAVLRSVVLKTWLFLKCNCKRINSSEQVIFSPLLVVLEYNCTAYAGHFCRESI